MIIGTHFLLFSKDSEADRTFFRDILEFPCIDAGEGWLIFSMSPAEAGIHPAEGHSTPDEAAHPMLGAFLYLMCDDLKATMTSLKSKNVGCTEPQTAPWGVTTTILLPSGGTIGLYQPRHPTALKLALK
jgi:hypothetical protein